jgi:hypothetical protein
MVWYSRLLDLGFHPLLTDSNGRGGYHLLIILSASIPTPKVFAFMRWLTSDHAGLGLVNAAECFPKQARLEPGRYGSWLRLPGRHHTREHCSRVWNGSTWLESAAAAEFILALAGDDPALIPAHALTVPAASRAVMLAPRRWQPATAEALAGRIRAYMARLPMGLGEGMHRDDYAYHFAAFLHRDLALSEHCTLVWLREWDRRQASPKGEQRLQEILRSVQRYGQRTVGVGLRSRDHQHA